MRLPSRLSTVCAGLIAAAAALGLSLDARAQATPFLGSWNLTGTGPDASYVYWLEVKEENGALSGRFLNRAGSPVNPDPGRPLPGGDSEDCCYAHCEMRK